MKDTAVVYICADSDGTPLYVGHTQYLPQRLAVHRRESTWFGAVVDVDSTAPMSRADAEAFEAMLVRWMHPPFNRTVDGHGGRPEKAAPPCGTVPAYRRHVRRGESVDDACRAAWAEYHRARRSE